MFKPKNSKPYWQMVFDLVEDRKIGDVVTYDEISEVIDQDVLKNRSVIYATNKHLLRDKKMLLVNVRNTGYKLVEGVDIMYHAEDRQVMAKRQIKKADFETVNINTIKLTADDKKKLQDFMTHNAIIRQAFKSNAKAIEAGVNATRTQLVGAEAQLAGAQITQLFTENQVKKLKELIGED